MRKRCSTPAASLLSARSALFASVVADHVMDQSVFGRGAPLIRVLLVDDHRLVAEAISRVLSASDDIVVLGMAMSVAALAGFKQRPDVILMDYMLPDGTGAEATRIAKARWPRVRVVMLTSIDAGETIVETVQAGADGYLTKDRALAEVVPAVRSVNAGEILLPPEIIGEIAKRLEDPHHESPVQALTGRELEVLRHLGVGASGRTIAAELKLSTETVRTHVQAIRRKLGASSRLEAVAIALRRRLIEPPSHPAMTKTRSAAVSRAHQ